MGTRLRGQGIEQIVDRPPPFADVDAGQVAILPDLVPVAHRIIGIGEDVDVDIDNGGIAQDPNASTAPGGRTGVARRIHEAITQK
jgi:hypothetical protein